MMAYVGGKAAMTKMHWLVLSLLLFIIVGAQGVAAQDLVQPDGRINQVAHFGGDALYCVDRDFNPTSQYSDFGAGGFRLLNSEGQELWFVPSDVIAAAVAEAKATGKGILVAEGRGSFGPAVIYTFVTADGDDYFVFTGYDEFGKPNTVEWKFCIPVGPSPEEPGDGDEPDELCNFIPFTKKPLVGKAYGAPQIIPSILIPCELCPNRDVPPKLSSRFRPLAGGDGGDLEGYCLEFPS